MKLDRLALVAVAIVCGLSATAALGCVLTGGQVVPTDADAPAPRRATRPLPLPEERTWYLQEFAQRHRAEVALALDIRLPDATPRELREARELAGLVRLIPAPVMRVLGRFRGGIVVYEGVSTDQPDIRDLRGVRCDIYAEDDPTWDEIEFLYRPTTRRAYVQFRAAPAWRSHAFLHELGHMLDHALGDPSQDPEFDAVFRSDADADDLGYPERVCHEEKRRSEYFADAFSDYHLPGDRHDHQRRRRPAAALYFSRLTARIAERDAAAIELLLDAELERRVRFRAGRATATSDRTPPAD